MLHGNKNFSEIAASNLIKIMPHYIRSLIARGEHLHLDFKFEVSDARKIAASFSAFANSSGGKLLIGVKDNGALAGVNTEEELYMIESAASYYCSPMVTFSARRHTVDGKTILEVDIPEGRQKPYRVKEKNGPPQAYIRIGDKNIKACNVQLMVWKKHRQPSGLLIADTEDKSRLLHFPEIHTAISFGAVCKLLPASRRKAEELLADLVYLDILEIEYADGKVFFRKKERPEGK